VRALGIVGVLAALLVGCSKEHPVKLTPGTRLIYHGGGDAGGVFTFCDRGNRVYYGESGQFQVIPGGCPDGNP
jgi:hypothetical protein